VGDAVASFNPIYGQGMSSAALHASCLAQYLSRQPDLHAPAAGFFGVQNVVVDAVWAISAGSDAARLDALSGADVPEEVSRQRWAMDQILRATLVDEQVCRALRTSPSWSRTPIPSPIPPSSNGPSPQTAAARPETGSPVDCPIAWASSPRLPVPGSW
jgi:2-polyprenyl-6-methoxyphenol hydroxylase-like FAD-dependent oxidoreductase